MSGRGLIRDNRFHVEAGAGWLMRAQQKGGGGYSRKYSLYDAWDKPYIETTGYIIPTMIAAGRYLNDDMITASAKRAACWLLPMQKDNGAFCDTDTGVEQVFDTGQVLTGLVAAYGEWGDSRFLDAAVRAGTWLAEVQEEDGSWQRFAYNGIKHSYYVKVAASLLRLFRVTDEGRYQAAALKNIRWALGRRTGDGYFRHMQFREGEYPFLHTITYVLEGLMESHEISGDEDILDAALKSANSLLEINRERDLLLCSQYGENWAPVNGERCVTGLAQWSGIAMKAYELTGNEDFLTQAIKTLYYLKSKQYLRPEQDLYGGLPGSVPLWGKYLGFCFPNWGVKFFIDALLSYEKYGVPLWREQETWVSEAFRFSHEVVREELGANDRKYVSLLEKGIDAEKAMNVLDIGCGRGKFIRHFKEKYPHWRMAGIDAEFFDDGAIQKGSIYTLPAPDGHADMVLLIEVMQHIDHLARAMAELSRVTKPGGMLVIGDRDGFSLVGLLKPLLETAGRWMYPWDSPFREKWRGVREWEKIFGDSWQIIYAKSFDDPDNRIPMSNRFYLLIARKGRP